MAMRLAATGIGVLLLASVAALVVMPNDSKQIERYCQLRAELDANAYSVAKDLPADVDRAAIVTQLRSFLASNKERMEQLSAAAPPAIRKDLMDLIDGLLLASNGELLVLQQDKYLETDMRVRSFERETCDYPPES